MKFVFQGADSFTTKVEESKDNGANRFDISIEFGKTCIPTPVTIVFYTPMIDTDAIWSPMGTNFDIVPNWRPHACESRLTGKMPLISLVAADGQNRITASLSDVKNNICFSAGVVEESCDTEWKITLFRTPSAPCSRYDLTLWMDDRQLPLYETVRPAVSRWERAYIPGFVPEDAYEPLYSTWYNFHQKISPDALLEELKAAKELGFRTVIVDDGWQCTDNNRGYIFTGDWQPQPEKIGDVRRFADACHALGLKVMFWYSVPFVGSGSQNYSRFTGKYLRIANDGEFGVLDPRYPEVRDFLVTLYRDAMQTYALDGLKLDFIDEFYFGANITLPTDDMDIPVLEDAVFRLMCDIHDAVIAVKPDALIEFRQTYVGPAVRAFGNMLRVNDCPYSANTNTRGVAELRMTSGKTAVHTDMIMWHPDTPKEDVSRQLLAAMFAVPQISVLLNTLPPDHLQVLQHFLNYYKENLSVLKGGAFSCDVPYRCNVMRVTQDQKQIAVVYHGNAFTVTSLQTDVFFCIGGNQLFDFTALGNKEIAIRVTNCCGDVVSENKASGLAKITVPTGGLAEIRTVQ